MSWDPSAYGRSFADVYDDWYGDRDDVASLEDALDRVVERRADRSLLELGVGTGRLAIPLAAAGWRVVGLDSSAEMLAVLAAKSSAVTAVEGDASDVSDYPAGPFDVVLAAYNFVFNLPDRSAQQACLAAAASVAGPDGRLVIEAFVPDATPPSGPVTSVGRADGVTIVTQFDPATGVVHGEHRSLDGRPRPWQVCPVGPAELDLMATASGWRLEHRWESWDGATFEPADSPTHVSVYCRT